MTVLVTGSAGRVGRTIAIHLMQDHKVVGLDATPCSTADIVGDIRNPDIMDAIPDGLDVIIHTAALHAPHVGLRTEAEFHFHQHHRVIRAGRQTGRGGGLGG